MEYLGTDIAVSDGGDMLTQPTGDVQLVSGRECLMQAIMLRLGTPRGGLVWHPEYGCDAIQMLQSDDNDANRTELQLILQEAALEDPRVDSVEVTVESWEREDIRVRVELWPIDDEDNPLNLVLGFGADGVEVVNA